MAESAEMRFIELYEKEPALWLKCHFQYRNNVERRNAMERIAFAMENERFRAEHVCEAFERLRYSYDAVVSSETRYEIPSWFKAMDVFMKHFVKGNSYQSVPERSEETVRNLQTPKESDVCDVCRDPTPEDTNAMIYCDSCNLCVHQACYGIPFIPEGKWYCKPCEQDESRPSCDLCPKYGGAMKNTSEGTWAHVSCAMWIFEVEFLDKDNVDRIDLSKIPKNRMTLLCSICGIPRGACIQCAEKRCLVAYHVTCAFDSSEIRMIMEDVPDSQYDVTLQSFCAKHANCQKSDGRKEKAPTREKFGEKTRKSRSTQCDIQEQSIIDNCTQLNRAMQKGEEECIRENKPNYKKRDEPHRFLDSDSAENREETLKPREVRVQLNCSSEHLHPLLEASKGSLTPSHKQGLNVRQTARKSFGGSKKNFISKEKENILTDNESPHPPNAKTGTPKEISRYINQISPIQSMFENEDQSLTRDADRSPTSNRSMSTQTVHNVSSNETKQTSAQTVVTNELTTIAREQQEHPGRKELPSRSVPSSEQSEIHPASTLEHNRLSSTLIGEGEPASKQTKNLSTNGNQHRHHQPKRKNENVQSSPCKKHQSSTFGAQSTNNLRTRRIKNVGNSLDVSLKDKPSKKSAYLSSVRRNSLPSTVSCSKDSKVEVDSLKTFGMYITALLRTASPKNALYIQKKILSTIKEELYGSSSDEYTSLSDSD